jgi:hypothetical protein
MSGAAHQSPSPAIAVDPIGDIDTTESDHPIKCGRCRLTFVQHPSIVVGQTPNWWLCPPCRTKLYGENTKLGSRWS